MSTITELEEKVKELLDEIETLKQKAKAEEFDYPFKENEKYWSVNTFGEVDSFTWIQNGFNTTRYNQGNAFKTQQEAIRERDRRALLTRFRQFRDKCNGDWKPEFDDFLQNKYNIRCDYGLKELFLFGEGRVYEFSLFGYFKNGDDCKHAIELFGDEIIRLWVDE